MIDESQYKVPGQETALGGMADDRPIGQNIRRLGSQK